MKLETVKAGEALVVRLDEPRLDAAVADRFRAAMIEILSRGERHLVIDLSRVDFVDSSGLGALVGVLKRVGSDGSLELAGLNRSVRKVLELTRMTTVFRIRDSAPLPAR